MRSLRGPLALLTAVFITGLAALGLISASDPPRADTARLNDAIQRLSAVWPHPEEAGLDGMADELRVVDASGNPVSLTARTEGSTEGGDADGQVVNQAGGLRTMQWTGEHRPLAAPVPLRGAGGARAPP